MRQITILLCAIFLIMSHITVHAQDRPSMGNTSELVISVTGFDNSNGMAMIALANSRQNYTEAVPFRGLEVPIVDRQATQTISVPYGEYAIKIFHDENGNKALDKMMFGIPKEKYGFSNNARARFGPPDYQDAVFKIDSAQSSMTIEIK